MTGFDWLTSFRKGDINLADAIAFYLTESCAPPDLRAAYEDALNSYKYTRENDGGDLAKFFGIKLTDRGDRQPMSKLDFINTVRETVDECHRQGYPNAT
jgi:hypothetical protein